MIDGKLYVFPDLGSNIQGLRAPDMLIAFGAVPEACVHRNDYVIAEQGKLPDFVLEVASRSTGCMDVEEKPADYAALGIPECWCFDQTGEHYGVRLAGDRYEPIQIMDLPDGGLEGCSEALNLTLRWGGGTADMIRPRAGHGHHVPGQDATHHGGGAARSAEAERRMVSARQARLEAERQAEEARQARLEVKHQTEVERPAWLETERTKMKRIRQLEDKLGRSRS